MVRDGHSYASVNRRGNFQRRRSPSRDGWWDAGQDIVPCMRVMDDSQDGFLTMGHFVFWAPIILGTCD